MSLKTQDVVIALKLSLDGESKAYAQKASELGMSASEVHDAEARLVEDKLLAPDKHSVLRKPLMDFLVYWCASCLCGFCKRVDEGSAHCVVSARDFRGIQWQQ